MQIPMMTKKQRAANQEAISQSVRKFMKERIGKKKLGGLNTIKMVTSKLEKASAAHAGQAKALSKIIPKKMMGGLLTKGIKLGYKQYRKAGGRSILQIMKSGVRGSGTRSAAKSDVRFGIKLHGRNLTKRDKSLLGR